MLLQQPPHGGNIRLEKQGDARVIVIHQGGYIFLRVYMAIMLCFALWFLFRDMIGASWMEVANSPSPAALLWFSFTVVIGGLTLWMLYRAMQRSYPQRLVLQSEKLLLDTGKPSLRMISNHAPFDKLIQLAFPRRQQQSCSRVHSKIYLEPQKTGDHRLWFISDQQKIELTSFTSEAERLWLHALLLEWLSEND